MKRYAELTRITNCKNHKIKSLWGNKLKRASLIIFDEAAFCSEEILAIAKAFGAQDMDFKTSTDEEFDPKKRPRQVPVQTIYASSQDTMDTVFYKNYKDFAKAMIAGDNMTFCCDMNCYTAMNVYMKGKEYQPLLSQSIVDAAMQENPEKARREYFNVATNDGGSSQIVKWATIRKNELPYVPYIGWKPNNKVVLAFDPARTNDNSILSAMNLREDPELGLCGDIVSCTNFIDTASSKKMKLDSNRQLAYLREILLAYNGEGLDYEYIDSIYLDSGAGGGGVSAYSDGLLNDWTDKNGVKHKGLIDKTYDVYQGYERLYPNAVDKLRLINPSKYRTQMVSEFIELINLGVIKFPLDNGGRDFIRRPKGVNSNGEEEFEIEYLTNEEVINFAQIELMKTEIASIHESRNAEGTTKTYALAKEKQNKMHDDRFYTILLLSHRLYELRRGEQLNRKAKKKNTTVLAQIRPPKLRK